MTSNFVIPEGFVGYVYCRTNTVNGKVYIGQCTRDNDPRWEECVAEALVGRGARLGASIKKHGRDVFSHKAIYYAKTQYELSRMETFFIILYQSHLSENGYNMTLGGEEGRWTEERKNNWVSPRTGKTLVEYFGEEEAKIISSKIRKARAEQEISEITRQKMSVSQQSRYSIMRFNGEKQPSGAFKLKRNKLRVCYGCFKSFDATGIPETTFCSLNCSSHVQNLMRGPIPQETRSKISRTLLSKRIA